MTRLSTFVFGRDRGLSRVLVIGHGLKNFEAEGRIWHREERLRREGMSRLSLRARPKDSLKRLEAVGTFANGR